MKENFVKLDKNMRRLLNSWKEFESKKFTINQDDCSWDEYNFLTKCGYIVTTVPEINTLSGSQNWQVEIRVTYAGRHYNDLVKQWWIEQCASVVVTAVTLLTSVASIVLSLISILS